MRSKATDVHKTPAIFNPDARWRRGGSGVEGEWSFVEVLWAVVTPGPPGDFEGSGAILNA